MSGRQVERRLAAVLAADVVGYSRMMAADETDTHARLSTLLQDFVEPTVSDHRDSPVRRSISRIGIPSRKCQRRITLNNAMSITP